MFHLLDILCIQLFLIRCIETVIAYLRWLARCDIEAISICWFTDMYDDDRQAICMRSLLSKLRKGHSNFPLIFARLHSGQFDAIRY